MTCTCGTKKIEKSLFTSTYLECPRCEGQEKVYGRIESVLLRYSFGLGVGSYRRVGSLIHLYIDKDIDLSGIYLQNDLQKYLPSGVPKTHFISLESFEGSSILIGEVEGWI